MINCQSVLGDGETFHEVCARQEDDIEKQTSERDGRLAAFS